MTSYLFTCKACKYGEYPTVIDIEGHKENRCRCRHPEIKMLEISSTDQKDFTLKDWAKINFLIHVILNIKINQALPYNRPDFLFPFRYNPIWVEGCDGFEI